MLKVVFLKLLFFCWSRGVTGGLVIPDTSFLLQGCQLGYMVDCT